MRVTPALSTKIEIAAVGAMSKSVEAVTGPNDKGGAVSIESVANVPDRELRTLESARAIFLGFYMM
jgi:hypothetical protein